MTLDSIRREEKAVLTVGTFDGVHLGHQFVLECLLKRARAGNALSTLVTFDPHPQVVLAPTGVAPIRVLTTIDEKIDALSGLGLERIVVIKFTRGFANMSSVQFVEDVLFSRIGFCEIIVGYDHAFGHNREGGAETLNQLGGKLGFVVSELPEMKKDAKRLNSTSIRRLLYAGDVAGASIALGRHYSLSGVIVKGAGRGKSLNYPTANIVLDMPHKLIPGGGVYAVVVYLQGQKRLGMMNIGTRPTFNGVEQTLEVHLFDFASDIYGHKMVVEFVERIRDEIAFPDREALIQQLNHDKNKSILILNQDILKEAPDGIN